MENEELGYRKLIVFQKADDLAYQVYLVSRKFPREEIFGLISQMRRCALSVPANIVEGYGKRTNKEKRQFCFNARGSLNELEYYIDFSFKLKYINKEEHEKLKNLRDEVGRLLFRYIESLEK